MIVIFKVSNLYFCKSNFPVTEKLTNGALVTPTPGERDLINGVLVISVDILGPRQNGCHFVDIFKSIFLTGIDSNFKFVPKRSNRLTWVQTMV